MDIDLVVNLKLFEDVLLEKCLGRRMCSQCGGNFNVANINVKGGNGNPSISMAPLLPPAHCMSKLITRPDDTEEVVKERLRVYNEKVSLHSFTILWLRKASVMYAKLDNFVICNVISLFKWNVFFILKIRKWFFFSITIRPIFLFFFYVARASADVVCQIGVGSNSGFISILFGLSLLVVALSPFLC